MSARQPFRPASRTATRTESNIAMDQQSNFPVADVLAPAPIVGKEGSSQMQKIQAEAAQKPFNITGLFPKRKLIQASKSHKSKSADDRSLSPADPWPMNQQALQIRSPSPASPIFASNTSTTGLLTVTTYSGPPGLPSPELAFARSAHEQKQDSQDAYFASDNSPSLLRPRPSLSLKDRMRSSSSLEKISEVLEEGEEREVPQEGHEEGDVMRQNTGYNDFQHSKRSGSISRPQNYPSSDSADKHVLRRTSKKRMQQSDEDDDYGSEKRFKGGEDEIPYSRQKSLVDRRSYRPSQDGGHPFGTESTLLQRIFGPAADTIIDGKIEVYESAQKRWAECSMEDWRAGAQELSSEFAEALDMVKNRMIEKMACYADLQTTLDEHKKVMERRDKDLDEARNDLVANSGIVVGRNTKD